MQQSDASVEIGGDGRRAARLEVHRAELLRRRARVLAVLGRDECRRDKREDNADDQ